MSLTKEESVKAACLSNLLAYIQLDEVNDQLQWCDNIDHWDINEEVSLGDLRGEK